jgi:hypothetical protein
MNARNTFIHHYQKAAGTKPASAGVIKAGSLYVLGLKREGCTIEEIESRLKVLIRTAGVQTPETSRLDEDILVHCIDHYHRPPSPAPPKPPEFLG